MPPSPHRPPSAGEPRRPAPAGPQRALEQMGLKRDIDFALHLPLRYEDETRLQPIAGLHDGDTAQVEGVVRDCRIETRPRRQLVARLRDDGGELVLRLLHFHPSQQRALAPGRRIRARGDVRAGFFGLEMVHPVIRDAPPGTPLATTLTPVYPTRAALPQAYLRKAVASALQRAPLDELLPDGSVPAGLPSLRDALRLLHHPPPQADPARLQDPSHPAWQRLKFDELLAQQLSQLQAQQRRAGLPAPVLGAPRADGLHARLLATLPFALTAAQSRVGAEIAADLARPAPMHRLLQGDVGSGKTVVAALAATLAIDSGWQCALMAPTEILAEQHFHKLLHWLQPLGVEVAWLTGGRKGRARARTLDAVAGGRATLVVGTHAVIQDDVRFARLGLCIVDEQHRFGVQQRLELRRKLALPEVEPHLLMMSATPIPRTLAMTYFADLDVSTIDELPPGRTPVLTKVFADGRRADVVDRIRDEVGRGRQVYWVCPLIEAGEAGESGQPLSPAQAAALELSNATQTRAELQQALPGCRVGLLHGRMPAAEKASTMADFVERRIDLLVCTTVIEVGVDVPNASLMVVEHAERFGLSQLHQLRGRVGRGATASVCVLLYAPPLGAVARARLRAMVQTADGFEIARRDLEIRGPGEFMGARQSGEALLRFADLQHDGALLEQARRVAPRLLRAHPGAAQAHVERWLATRTEFLKA